MAYYRKIQVGNGEVKAAFKRMNNSEVVGLDGIPIEVWKFVGE